MTQLPITSEIWLVLGGSGWFHILQIPLATFSGQLSIGGSRHYAALKVECWRDHMFLNLITISCFLERLYTSQVAIKR